MSKRILAAVVLLATASIASAQMRSGHGPGFGRFGINGSPPRQFGNAFFLGEPFLSGYPMQVTSPPVPVSPVVVVQQPPAPVAPEPKLDPLMIEWRGDRYVRVGGSETEVAVDYAQPSSVTSNRPINELSPVVLVFRDGHREKVSDYVIANGTLYTQGDYIRTGSWRRNIALATLDLPATLGANREKGVRFVLPAAPNEVVTRP